MVFDVDKLKEAVEAADNADHYDSGWQIGPYEATTLTETARLVVAGQPLWWCETHQSKRSRAVEVCEATINIAYRVGRNPFDRITCRMVEGWWMPTGGNE